MMTIVTHVILVVISKRYMFNKVVESSAQSGAISRAFTIGVVAFLRFRALPSAGLPPPTLSVGSVRSSIRLQPLAGRGHGLATRL